MTEQSQRDDDWSQYPAHLMPRAVVLPELRFCWRCNRLRVCRPILCDECLEEWRP